MKTCATCGKTRKGEFRTIRGDWPPSFESKYFDSARAFEDWQEEPVEARADLTKVNPCQPTTTTEEVATEAICLASPTVSAA